MSFAESKHFPNKKFLGQQKHVSTRAPNMGVTEFEKCLETGKRTKYLTYSLVSLVLPNTEELISRPFMSLSKLQLLLQDRMIPKKFRFFVIVPAPALFITSAKHTYIHAEII